MAVITRKELPRRFRYVATQIRLRLLDTVLNGARNVAFGAAHDAPVDTGRLRSNFKMGNRNSDFVFQEEAFDPGSKGSTATTNLAALVLHNERVSRRLLRQARTRAGARGITSISVQNRTPYLQYVEERQPFLRQATQSALSRMRAAIRSLRIRI